MNLLFIGDVVGRPGRRAVETFLPGLREELGISVVLANGENLAGGAGLTKDTAEELFKAGVDLITGGNHLYDKREGHAYIESESRLCRPANYPPGAPGRTWVEAEVPGGLLVAGCLLGRVFMRALDDPFRAADDLVARARERGARYLVVDMHAEATSEKRAMGWHLAGRASVVVGTHTHVPTGDEEILPGGTAYLTDLGMTGPYDSVIGMQKEAVLGNFKTGLYHRFQPAQNDIRLYALLIELDEETGHARSVRRIVKRLDREGPGA